LTSSTSSTTRKRGKQTRTARKKVGVVDPVVASVEPVAAPAVPRRSRRITLKGLGIDNDVELSLFTTTTSQYDQDQDESVEFENLKTEELLKMRDALRLAEQKTSRLLANLGY
jgi:hypothetical protein